MKMNNFPRKNQMNNFVKDKKIISKNESNNFVKNKKKQGKIISKLNAIKIKYDIIVNGPTYKEARESGSLCWSSEDLSHYNDERSDAMEALEIEYNRLNEKLPHNMRLEIL